MEYSYFSRELTTQALQFEVWLFIVLVAMFAYGMANYKFFVWKFLSLAVGVFFFEGISWALWINSNLGESAYIHNDISWVMTLAWASIIMFVKMAYDTFQKKLPWVLSRTKLKKLEHFELIKEFTLITVISSVLWWIFVMYLKSIWVFSYSPEIQVLVESGTQVFGRPLEAIVYLPVFIFTVYSFFKYWELAIHNKHLFDDYKVSLSKDILISIITISLIWYLVHPIILIENIFIFILLVIWYVINLLITWFVISKFSDVSLFMRFISWTFIFTTLGSLVISFFVKYWYIDFSQSIKDTYTVNTIQMPYMHITDVEFSGILLFSYLMIAMTKYFKIITDNKQIKIKDTNMTFKGFKSLFINQK